LRSAKERQNNTYYYAVIKPHGVPKQKAGQGISPLPGFFVFVISLNHAKNFEHKHDNTHSIKPNLI
jgi:hypothetical protein